MLSLTMEMAPYLLLGFLIAGILHIYLPENFFKKWFGKRGLKSVVYASLMGIPLPLCSCGVIPTGISLYKDGASKGSTVSFLISTPQTGVDSIVVTYSLLGLPFAIIRPIIALVTGVLGGVAVNAFDRDEQIQTPHKTEKHRHLNTTDKMSGAFRYAYGEFLGEIADWLVIGLVLAGFISVLIPADFFETSIFSNELLSMFIVLIASIPFYVCATGSVPIAAALLLKGLNPGAVLVFLMAGPATNIATITVISQTLGRRTLILYLSALILGSFVFGLIINEFFPAAFFTPLSTQVVHHSGAMYWIEIGSAVLLLVLILRHYIGKVSAYMNKLSSAKIKSEESVLFEVEGMTCNNCKSKVETALLKIKNVSESKADLGSHKVEVKGHSLKMNEIKKAVEEIGYVYKELT